MQRRLAASDPLTLILETCCAPERTAFAHAWVGLEPTFQTAKSVRKWKKMCATPALERAYFHDDYMVRTEAKIAKATRKQFQASCAAEEPHCLFSHVEMKKDRDQWGSPRRKLRFYWTGDHLPPLTVNIGIDPETFEYGIKPVPLAWLYDERFVAFLEAFIWQVPLRLGLSSSMAHGGAQFHFSAKTFLTGSLLVDDIADRLSHPELASWIMDYPEVDSRAFRATHERSAAYRKIVQDYWEGRFHPRAIGVLTSENAYFDRGFTPSAAPHEELMDPSRGPIGDAREIFQTNFAFGRAVRWQAQNVHSGYWQYAHPQDDGYRPDQVMRYSEGNLNRLEIVGALHVKSDKVLEPERVPEFEAPLDLAMLATEASWENRAQVSRLSARDYVEAILLEAHHAQYLQAHPHVAVKDSLAQDQILADAERTLQRRGRDEELARLHREARVFNLEASRGRVKSDRIEPETLFWAAWHALPSNEKAAIADEAVAGFIERVENAAAMDPRAEAKRDPMEWHRHRIHPLLWDALAEAKGASAPVRAELAKWQENKARYLARRPPWSQDESNTPPWEQH